MKSFLPLVSLFLIFACSQSDDGPISIYPEEIKGEYSGYVLEGVLDSGKSLHLKGDSLYVTLDSLWTLSNCFLDEIVLEESREDSILYLVPKIKIALTSEDCASPLYFPETTLALFFGDELKDVREIRLMNSKGEPEDTITVRKGSFLKDTLNLYVDSSFANPYLLPRRTKGLPSILKTIDSLKEREFYYRLMPSNCTYIIDTCETRPDTLYPSTWSLRDTNLVPLRETCKDSTLRYCLSRDWNNDSLNLEKLQIKKDTLWYYSWFLVQELPKGGALNEISYSTVLPKSKFTVTEEIFVPVSKEEYVSSEDSTMLFFRLDSGEPIVYGDSLLNIFENALVGRDTL